MIPRTLVTPLFSKKLLYLSYTYALSYHTVILKTHSHISGTETWNSKEKQSRENEWEIVGGKKRGYSGFSMVTSLEQSKIYHARAHCTQFEVLRWLSRQVLQHRLIKERSIRHGVTRRSVCYDVCKNPRAGTMGNGFSYGLFSYREWSGFANGSLEFPDASLWFLEYIYRSTDRQRDRNPIFRSWNSYSEWRSQGNSNCTRWETKWIVIFTKDLNFLFLILSFNSWSPCTKVKRYF